MKNRGDRLFISICILVLIMVNPPVLNIVNNFAKSRPMIKGYPSIWLWLQTWYFIGALSFLLAGIFLDSWKKDYRGKDK